MNKGKVVGRYGIDMTKVVEGVPMEIKINLVKSQDLDLNKLEQSLKVIEKYLDNILEEIEDKIKSEGYKGINGYFDNYNKSFKTRDSWVYEPDNWLINVKLFNLFTNEQFISNMSELYRKSLAKKQKWTGFNVKFSQELQNKIKNEIQLIYN